jgi:hypothetical protein
VPQVIRSLWYAPLSQVFTLGLHLFARIQLDRCATVGPFVDGRAPGALAQADSRVTNVEHHRLLTAAPGSPTICCRPIGKGPAQDPK